MKRISFIILSFILVATNSQLKAQSFKEKTIFQLLKVPDTRKPLNAPASQGKKEEIEKEYDLAVVDDGMNRTTGADEGINTVATLPEWLKQHPAGKNAATPELLMNLIVKGPFYDGKLEFTDPGFRVVTDFGDKRELGILYYVPAGKTGGGFNALDKEKNSRYYTSDGRLLFDRIFAYVEEDENNCYRFYEGMKCGITDSTGKVILPAKYDEAYSFIFNNKYWFSVQKGDKQYYLEQGSDQPVLNNENGRAAYLPEITGGRYWLTNGRVYDMQAREELFSSIDKVIKSGSDHWPLFYIEMESNSREGDEERIYFDGTGRLLLGQPIAGQDGLSDTTTILKVYVKDTLVKEKKVPLYKYGIIHDKGEWLRKPVYDYMKRLDPTNAVAFFSRGWKSPKPGLMDAAGKILIEEGRYLNIEEGLGDHLFVCYNENGSWAWDRRKNNFTKLQKNYFVFRCYGKMEKLGLVDAITTKNEHYLIDTNLNLLDTTAWSDISISKFDQGNLLELFPIINGDRYYYEERVYMTRDLQRISFSWNGKTYDTFMDVDSLAPGSYFYQRKDKKNIVQVKPGVYFETDCERVQYDPFFNWYIGYKKRNCVLLDDTGKELIPAFFHTIKPYSSYFKTATFSTGSNSDQQIDREGKLLFNGKYDHVTPITASFFIVRKGDESGVLHRNGKVIIPVSHAYLELKYGMIWYGTNEYTAQSMPVGSLQEKE